MHLQIHKNKLISSHKNSPKNSGLQKVLRKQIIKEKLINLNKKELRDIVIILVQGYAKSFF
jgi:hypothetical protein